MGLEYLRFIWLFLSTSGLCLSVLSHTLIRFGSWRSPFWSMSGCHQSSWFLPDSSTSYHWAQASLSGCRALCTNLPDSTIETRPPFYLSLISTPMIWVVSPLCSRLTFRFSYHRVSWKGHPSADWKMFWWYFSHLSATNGIYRQSVVALRVTWNNFNELSCDPLH